jgi:hypothetical protein
MRRLTRVDAMLALTIVIWAFNIMVTRYVLTNGFRPLAYGSIRYAAAALLAAGVALGLERSLAVGGRRSLLRSSRSDPEAISPPTSAATCLRSCSRSRGRATRS